MTDPILLLPKVDFVFKRIFGNEKHPNVLISFLNAVLNPVDPIKSIILKDTTIEKESLESKFSRLDVKATTDKGEEINIEIQIKDEKNMIQRSLYYWSRMYYEQLKKGDVYDKLSRTICINLLDFNLLPCDKFHSVYRLKECQTNEELTDLEEIHFIELKKMKTVNNIEEINSQLEEWIYFINQPESELVQKLERKNEDLKEAKEELIRLSGDEETRKRYEKRMDTLRNERSALKSAEEKGLQKGLQQGLQKGLQQGIQKGMEKGLQKGMERGLQKGMERGLEQGANREKLKIANNLIQNGLDNEFIIETTGLTLDEVTKLRKDNESK